VVIGDKSRPTRVRCHIPLYRQNQRMNAERIGTARAMRRGSMRPRS
jgi:hypothetical protein